MVHGKPKSNACQWVDVASTVRLDFEAPYTWWAPLCPVSSSAHCVAPRIIVLPLPAVWSFWWTGLLPALLCLSSFAVAPLDHSGLPGAGYCAYIMAVQTVSGSSKLITFQLTVILEKRMWFSFSHQLSWSPKNTLPPPPPDQLLFPSWPIMAVHPIAGKVKSCDW